MNTHRTLTGRIGTSALSMALGLGIMVHSSAAQQQQSGKIIGARLTTPQPFNFVRVPPAQKAAAGEMMQKLYDIVRRDTMFYEPVAFDVQPSARIDVFPRSGYAPVQYDLPYFMFAYGPDTAKTQSGWRTSPRNFTAHGNGIELFFIEANKWQTDERGIMYFEPTRLPDIKGYPTYGRGLTVVTRSERPIFVSVPLERTMKVVIAENSKGLDAMKDPTQQPIVARMKACVAKHEKELAAMSPAERAGPTYVSMLPAPGRDRSCDPFASASDKGAMRIIMENPDFYDTKRPITDIQVVFVGFGGFNTRVAIDKSQLERVADRLDWAALAALTAKP